MFAIRLHEFGPPENLVYEEVSEPSIGPGQVRIRVGAAGVHLIDTSIRRGDAIGPYPLPELPTIPGREVAGVVTELGDGVDARWSGRRVVAHLGQASGGYAEQAVRDVDSVHDVPTGVSDEAAVAMIGTGRTTQAILEAGPIHADDVVLVTSAAGGIGSLLVQEATSVGATVVAVAGGGAKVHRVRELGADLAVDYDVDGWSDAVRAALDRQVTIVFDGVGGVRGQAALDLLAPGGQLVMYGWSSGNPTEVTSALLFERSISATAAIGARLLQRPGGFRDLERRALAAAEGGRWTPITDRFALRDAASAHSALESRATMGKVVLLP